MMSDTSDALLFNDDDAASESSDGNQPWLVLIVDDEPEVHAVTSLMLGNVTYRNRPVQLLSAYSSVEALSVMARYPGIAVVLLDVVMETEDAGLRLVRIIRDDMENHGIRIILRTGQPGQAPVREVISQYDINDYKSKAELTTERAFIALITALRSYEGIISLQEAKEAERQAFVLAAQERNRREGLVRIQADERNVELVAIAQTLEMDISKHALAVADSHGALRVFLDMTQEEKQDVNLQGALQLCGKMGGDIQELRAAIDDLVEVLRDVG